VAANIGTFVDPTTLDGHSTRLSIWCSKPNRGEAGLVSYAASGHEVDGVGSLGVSAEENPSAKG
jgi:hypothetical protein